MFSTCPQIPVHKCCTYFNSIFSVAFRIKTIPNTWKLNIFAVCHRTLSWLSVQLRWPGDPSFCVHLWSLMIWLHAIGAEKLALICDRNYTKVKQSGQLFTITFYLHHKAFCFVFSTFPIYLCSNYSVILTSRWCWAWCAWCSLPSTCQHLLKCLNISMPWPRFTHVLTSLQAAAASSDFHCQWFSSRCFCSPSLRTDPCGFRVMHSDG